MGGIFLGSLLRIREKRPGKTSECWVRGFPPPCLRLFPPAPRKKRLSRSRGDPLFPRRRCPSLPSPRSDAASRGRGARTPRSRSRAPPAAAPRGGPTTRGSRARPAAVTRGVRARGERSLARSLPRPAAAAVRPPGPRGRGGAAAYLTATRTELSSWPADMVPGSRRGAAASLAGSGGRCRAEEGPAGEAVGAPLRLPPHHRLLLLRHLLSPAILGA